MLSLNAIEPEIILMILEYVHDTSPKTTKAVACVNKHFNRLTRTIAHHHEVIDIQGYLDISSRIMTHVKSWLEDAEILANIRTLTVKGHIEADDIYDFAGDQGDVGVDEDENESNYEDYDDDRAIHKSLLDNPYWKLLARLVLKVGRLRQLDWNVHFPIPLSILNALERHQPLSKLRIFNFTRPFYAATKPTYVETRLAQSNVLTHLRCAAHSYVDRIPWTVVLAFRGIVGSAPKLEYAGLVNANAVDETQGHIKLYKPLFIRNERPNSSIRELTLDGPGMSKSTLDHWSTTIDLTRLQTLKFSRGYPTLEYFQHAASYLPNLRSLSLNLVSIQPIEGQAVTSDMQTTIDAVQNYLEQCSPLQTLSLWSYSGTVNVDPVIRRHGSTLEHLQLHEREVIGRKQRDVLDVPMIKVIRSSCPTLKTFTFDINRSDHRLRWDSDTNRELYDELSKFKHLDKIQIYLDLGANDLYGNYLMSHIRYALSENSEFEGEDIVDTSGINQSADSATSTSIISNIVPDNVSNPESLHTSSHNPSGSPGAPALPDTIPPASKKPRLEPTVLPPSSDKHLEAYAKQVWKTVFTRKGGARQLDVKVGEWESREPNVLDNGASDARKRHLTVRDNDRDDVSEPVVIVHQKHRPRRRP